MCTQNQTEPLLILYSRPRCSNNILTLAKYDSIQPHLGRFLCSLVLPYLLFLCSWQSIWHMCVSKQNACYFISFIDFSGHDGKDEQKNKTILGKYHFLLWVASSFKFYNVIEVNNKMYVIDQMTQGTLKQLKDSKVHLIKKVNQYPNTWKKIFHLASFLRSANQKRGNILVVLPVAE